MNSETLQRTFPEVYQDFFSRCSTVVSAPGAFFWSGGLSVMYGGVGILEKLPIRVYVGLEHTNERRLRLGQYTAYVPHQQQFENFSWQMPFEKQFNALISQLQADFPKHVHGRLHILAEVPRGSGLSQSGALNMALATMMGLESGLLTTERLQELVTLPTKEAVRDPAFDRIYRSAWKLETCTHFDVGSGSAPFAAFFESGSPFVWYSARRQGTHTQHPHSLFPSDVEGHYDDLDAIPYSGYRFHELFGWRNAVSWPVDYGLAYLGIQKSKVIYLKPMPRVRESLEQVEQFSQESLAELISGPKAGIPPAFIEIANEKGPSGYWEQSVNFLILLSVKALHHLRWLLEFSTDASLNELYKAVQLEENVFEFFTEHVPEVGERDVLGLVRQALRQKTNSDLHSIRLLPDRPGGGGNLLFVAPQGYFQDRLDRFVQVLRTEVSPMVRLDHISWQDGSESGGVRVEQRLSHGLHSAFVGSGTTKATVWDKAEEPAHRIISTDTLEQMKNSTDLFLDASNHKIFIRGQALTSKHIKSATATIEILKILLAKRGQDVPADALPHSAYAERNEMQSKIISPLTSAFEEMTGQKLPLSLHGGLQTNYTVRFNGADITIALTEE